MPWLSGVAMCHSNCMSDVASRAAAERGTAPKAQATHVRTATYRFCSTKKILSSNYVPILLCPGQVHNQLGSASFVLQPDKRERWRSDTQHDKINSLRTCNSI